MPGPPSIAEVVGLVVRMEDDPSRRNALGGAPFEFFKVAHEAGLVAWDEMPAFANVVGEAVQRGLLGYHGEMGGVILPPPETPWTDHAFQSRFGYYSTVDGQQVAALHRQRRERVGGGSDDAIDADEPLGEARRHWRSQVDFVFELPAPSSFPPLERTPDADGLRILRRYITQVGELAASALMNKTDIGYTVSFGKDAGVIDSTLPSSELPRGLALLFRQLYAPDERASFASAMRVLQEAVRGQESAAVQAQVEQLSRWGRAAGKLRADWLEALAFERGKDDGKLPEMLRAPVPEQTPEQILSVFFYGEYIHWNKWSTSAPAGAETVEEWASEPFTDAHYRFFFLTAVAQLAAIYVPFGDVVAAALGDEVPDN